MSAVEPLTNPACSAAADGAALARAHDTRHGRLYRDGGLPNLRKAQALRLEVPPALLARTTEVLE